MMSYEKLYDLFEIILVIKNCYHKEIQVYTFSDSFVAFNVYGCQEILASMYLFSFIYLNINLHFIYLDKKFINNNQNNNY